MLWSASRGRGIEIVWVDKTQPLPFQKIGLQNWHNEDLSAINKVFMLSIRMINPVCLPGKGEYTLFVAETAIISLMLLHFLVPVSLLPDFLCTKSCSFPSCNRFSKSWTGNVAVCNVISDRQWCLRPIVSRNIVKAVNVRKSQNRHWLISTAAGWSHPLTVLTASGAYI